ncbi:MAG: tetratricopeptide repeat protein [Candidatus Pacebacteria bacterium]|jgi:tetratricopeptide (TPR) repeat protein|nr:tetratricopeptide repeat protein [Candidatus Paceibacterota bacterium]
MDFDLLPQLIIIFSIAGILFIVGRNFSKVKEAAAREEIFLEESAKEKEEKEKFLYLYRRAVRRINKENYQKKMADFWLWLEKFLRRVRIIIMKLDGKMVATLERLRKKNVKSIENLKDMASITEKNVLSSKEVKGLSGFLSGKGAYRKKNKAQEVVPAATDKEAEKDKTLDIHTENADSFVPKEKMLLGDKTVSIETEEKTVSAEILPEAIVTEEVDIMAEEIEIKVEAERMEEPEETVIVEESEETKKDKKEVKPTENVEEEKIRTKKEQECIELLMHNPADIKAYWRLGLIYSKRRNYEDALACFSQIVKIDPTYTKAKQKVIELMEKMKKKGK